MAGNVAPNMVTDGLVLYIDAANTKSYVSGSTTWVDIAAGNNGTLINGPTYSSTNGGNIIFDGVDDYCNVPVGLLTSSINLTVEFIAKFTDNPFTMTGGMSTYKSCYPYFYGGSLGFEGFVSGYSRPTDTGTGYGLFSVGMSNYSTQKFISCNVNINVPYIMTAVYSPTTMSLYVNGILTSSIATGFNPNFDTFGLRLGSGNRSFNGFFNGTIYNYKQYNRALSAAEVTQNYNALKGRYGL